MTKKFVIDGAFGSGKTTILFGRGSEEPLDTHHDCLKDRGFNVLREACSIALHSVKDEELPLIENLDEIFRRLTEIEIERYFRMQDDKTTFQERGLLAYEVIAQKLGATLPPNFYKYVDIIQYDGPIIMLEPISSFDMSKQRQSAHELRVATYEERIEMHRAMISLYREKGYDVVEIAENLPISPETSDPFSLRVNEILKETMKR
jgi:predicted ATPase